MIHPIIKFTIFGVLWYQGEENDNEPEKYRCMFPALITDWRQKFIHSNPKFPFLFVQVSTWDRAGGLWPALRDAQMEALKLDAVGMAVSYDKGDYLSPTSTIHPRNKQEVGRRLFFSARHFAYRITSSIYRGPTVQTINLLKDKVSNGTRYNITIYYEADSVANSILFGGTEQCKRCCDNFANGFEVLTLKKEWITSKTNIIANRFMLSQIVLEDTNTVTGIRYNWYDWPECALYNSANLPAPPFIHYFQK